MAENGDQLDQPALDYGEFDTSEVLDTDASLDVTDDHQESGDHDDSIQTEDADLDDPELEAIKARVKEMEEEAEKLKEMQNEVEKQMNLSPGITSPLSMEDKIEVDGRSIYVGNVDYGSTAEELEAHFHGCGSINRVTIQCDKFSGHPKGFAYIEFADKDSVQTAEALHESLFRGRQIKVIAKRTNRPGITTSDRGRGRGYRGRGGYRGGYRGYSGYTPRGRGRGGYRPRRSAWYSPY